MANLCLMVHEEDNEVSTSNSSQFTCNELQDALMTYFLSSKRWELKTVFSKGWFLLFPKKMRAYKRRIKFWKMKFMFWMKNVKYLKTTLLRCVNKKKKLDAILGKQKCSLDKTGLSFNPSKWRIFSKIRFVSSNEKSQISCFYCQKSWYIASSYYAIQKSNALNNAWVSRRPLRTNSQGPKMVWVPKVKWTLS